MKDTISAGDSVDSSIFSTVHSRSNTDSLKWDRYLGQDVIPMWVADMDFQVAEPIQKALEERLAHSIYGYTVAPDSLREAVISHLQQEYQWQVQPEWLVFLPGVVTGLALSCRAYCSDNAEIMVNPPIYHHFYDSHENKRQQLVKVPLHKQGHRWTYDIAAMAKACTPSMQMLMMCTPHNPTGTVFQEDELQAVAALCKANNMLMISDEIHCDLVIDRSVQHVPTAKACPDYADRIVTLMSGSKTWNIAGLNTSFAIISDESLRRQFMDAQQSLIPPVPPLALVATEAAYRHGGPWRKSLLDYLAGNFARIEEMLDSIAGVKLEKLEATYLAWIDASELSQHPDIENVQTFFEQHGVGFSSGEQFGQPNYIRMNFACPRDTLDKALARMQLAVDSLGSA